MASPHRPMAFPCQPEAAPSCVNASFRSRTSSGRLALPEKGQPPVCAKRTVEQIAIDDALTKELNTYDLVHEFLARCTATLSRRFDNDPRVFFYLKGSAALSRYLRKWGVPDQVVDEICARSDWDTQLVINPGLPRGQWFAALRECHEKIVDCLDQFEEELLQVFLRHFAPGQQLDQRILAGKTDDPTVRKQQNALASKLRQSIADTFAGVFLATVKREGFDEDGPNHWRLRWNDIKALANGVRKAEILELGIQAHNRATLTSALIHPGQALDNLNSVLTTQELDDLLDATRAKAQRTWDRMSEVCGDYDDLLIDFIHEDEQLTTAVVQRLREFQPNLGAIANLRDTNVDQGKLAYVLAAHHGDIVNELKSDQRQRLAEILQRIDAEFDQYDETPDPEEVAEAEQREIEKLAPFALVSQEKGSRKIGSILENMAIRDFYLYRLMIRCQLNNQLIPDAPQGMKFDEFKQRFKFRAELLDVSVPRDDSLETAEQWTHTRHHITLHDGIPLPNGAYFLDEYMLMFREVLDKKSSSAHKLTKRLRRACLIATVFARELGQPALLERMSRLDRTYPPFGKLLKLGGTVAPANAVVLLRMFEQLVESYDLAHNEKLALDSVPLLRTYAKDFQRLLGNELTHETFLELMRIYAHLGSGLYRQGFVLAGYRRKQISDARLLDAAGHLLSEIRKAFGNDPARVRCAIVEDFAIAVEPDLPNALKQTLPLDVLKIVVYATANEQQRLKQTIEELSQQIFFDLAPGQVDAVGEGNVLYLRLRQESDTMRDADRGQASTGVGQAVFLKIECIVGESVENWIVPSHEHDLRAIVKQYRRSLPRYTEYYAVTRRKAILQQLERALTTY
jgi:hypothetical protein